MREGKRETEIEREGKKAKDGEGKREPDGEREIEDLLSSTAQLN